MLIEYYHEIHVARIYQEGNGIEDELEKFGHGVKQFIEWEEVILLPQSMQVMIERECTFNNAI